MEEEILSKEWLIGFIEGEGNFHVALSNKKNNPSYPFDVYPVLQFRIFLREDDLGVLNKIREFLGIGRIYKKKTEYNRRMGFRARDQYVYCITHSKELLKLKEILTPTAFHTKKAKDREIFFNVLDLKVNKKHLTAEGNEQIITMAKMMNSGMRENFKIKPYNHLKAKI